MSDIRADSVPPTWTDVRVVDDDLDATVSDIGRFDEWSPLMEVG